LLEVELVRQPAIYLDHDSLTDIARTPARRQRFLDIWARKGELLFSFVNALDLAGPQGDTTRYIRDLLQDLGPHWIPLDMNPWKVVRKEKGEEPSIGSASVSEAFLRPYFLELRDEVTNVGRVVDLIQNDRQNTLADALQLKTAADQMVQTFRAEFIRDEASLERNLPATAYDPARPTTFMLRQLERLVTREARSHTWKPNDGLDFMHAAIASGASDLLLLDRQWKRRVLEVAPPKTYPWVFYRYELDDFLAAFDACVIG
jgi:hypothetical protein